MKNHVTPLLLVCFLLGDLVIAQADEKEIEIPPARVIGGISTGKITPPPPPKVLPEYEVTKTHVIHKGGQKITINRVLPPLPSVKIPLSNAEHAAQTRKLKNQKMVNDSSQSESLDIPYGGFFMVSATIYDHKVTLIEFQNDRHKKPYKIWSNFDWNHLSGFMSFEGRGKRYDMMMLSRNQSIGELKRLKRLDHKVKIPKIPRLPGRLLSKSFKVCFLKTFSFSTRHSS